MIDARLKRIKELLSESEKRNGELAHENFELKKRIAELEEIDIVHCGECKNHQEDGYCTVINARTFDDAFCSCGGRKDDDNRTT